MFFRLFVFYFNLNFRGFHGSFYGVFTKIDIDKTTKIRKENASCMGDKSYFTKKIHGKPQMLCSNCKTYRK